MQGTPMRLDCMNKGPCVAAPMSQPEDLFAMQKGFRKLGDTHEVIPVLQFSVIAARRSWATANRNSVVRLARAFADAYRFVHDRSRRDEVVAVMNETMNIPAPVAQAMLSLYLDPDRGVMPKQAEISSAGIAKVTELIGSVGEIKPPFPDAERFIDRQYLQAAGVR
jgi:ABC-type nitrate/sulfonate/bicarbonate transport system substrate-binding protein